MGRPKGSKNRKRRAAKRTPYQTYSDWYDKYTKGHKKGWFRDKLTPAEFADEYQKALDAKISNPARSIAMAQEYVDRTFEKRYKELYGQELGDIRDKATREQLFYDFVDEMQMQGLTYDEAREEFERYFY